MAKEKTENSENLQAEENKIKLTLKQKIAAVVIAAVVILDIVLAAYLISNRKVSKVLFTAASDDYSSALVAENSLARNGLIKENGDAVFKFNAEQQKKFAEIYEKNSTGALVLRLNVSATEKQKDLLLTGSELPFNFGVLYESDYDKSGKLAVELNRVVSVHSDLNKLFMAAGDGTFDVSISLKKDDEGSVLIPEGFFVSSTLQCRILSVCAAPALLGFDSSTQVPFYGYSCNGGIIDFSNASIDFSSASMVFPSENTFTKSMPQLVVKLSCEEDLCSTFEHSVRARINFGGERIYIKNVKDANELTIPSGALKNPFSIVEITENKQCITSMIMQSVPETKLIVDSVPEIQGFDKQASDESQVYVPVKTDPGLILKYSMKNWRNPDYEIFQWDRYPDILFFDIKNYDIQDKFFRRIAYFIEKAGYKGRLLTNEELEGKHGYNAHDYSAESLAKFFIKADKTGFKLNREENILRDILLQNGLLVKDGKTVKAGNGGLVSISQETMPGTRANLLAHEGWHTIYFRDKDFRDYVSVVFYTLDADSMNFVIDYFKSQPGLGYDTEDEYLMHNEFMAYLMQQPLYGDNSVAKYFVHLANRGSVIDYTPVLASYVRKTEGRTFEDAALILNDYVFDHYGILGGNIALVQR